MDNFHRLHIQRGQHPEKFLQPIIYLYVNNVPGPLGQYCIYTLHTCQPASCEASGKSATCFESFAISAVTLPSNVFRRASTFAMMFCSMASVEMLAVTIDAFPLFALSSALRMMTINLSRVSFEVFSFDSAVFLSAFAFVTLHLLRPVQTSLQ